MWKTERRKQTPIETQRTIHEVENTGYLFSLVLGFNDALNRIADGLHAIALAVSTKEDNSAQVLEFVAKIKTAREKLQTSLNNQHKETE